MLSCQSLTKEFGGRTVVDDVTFEVPAGTITGFVGSNGAGKTTTMRMLLGLVAPTSGAALVKGRPYGELEHPRRQVGAVVDGPGANPGHTARAHLTVMATAADLPLPRVDEVLDVVGLTEHAARRVGGFSMGMLQRLALAGALLGDPEVLLLDEPVNGLDPPGILWVRDMLQGLAADGRALLVSSHLLSELAEIADRVVIIDQGRMVADAPLDELLAGSAQQVELRCANPGRMAQAVTAANGTVDVDGDTLVIHGMSAREAGELAEAAGAGPVYWLTERGTRFEDVYFQLAGAAPSPAHATNGRA